MKRFWIGVLGGSGEFGLGDCCCTCGSLVSVLLPAPHALAIRPLAPPPLLLPPVLPTAPPQLLLLPIPLLPAVIDVAGVFVVAPSVCGCLDAFDFDANLSLLADCLDDDDNDECDVELTPRSFVPNKDDVTSAPLTSKTFFSVDVAAIKSANEPGNRRLLLFFVLLVY